MVKIFEKQDLKKLWQPDEASRGEDNGQIVIIGGSELFSGAPLFSLIAASKLVDMVFLATPETDRGAAEKTVLFGRLRSVVWIPREDLGAYIDKSDAVLIGPGLMRFHGENDARPEGPGAVLDKAGTETRMLTQYLLGQYSHKRWVVDGGSLQVVEPKWLPAGAVVTPNSKEYEILFGEGFSVDNLEENAKKYSIIISYKGPVSYVSDGLRTYEIRGGNAGLTKGGTGDVLAGLTAGLLAKNEPLLSAAAAGYIVKKTAEELYNRVGYHFSADDLAEAVFPTMNQILVITA